MDPISPIFLEYLREIVRNAFLLCFFLILFLLFVGLLECWIKRNEVR